MFKLVQTIGLARASNPLTRIKNIRLPSTVISRQASQLYPATSQKWDAAMVQAEVVAGDSSNFSNLQQLVGKEFTSITKYLQKLIGTNHPMLETAKRCTYISEGRMGSAQARGLVVVLTAKAIEDMVPKNSTQRDRIVRRQISLAEMTEMTYSAYMIHRGVMDLKMHGLEQVDFKYDTSEASRESLDNIRGLHYGNKVSILCGDFLLAYVMRGLGDLFSSKAVDLVASAITDFTNGEFLLIDDWRSKNYLLTENSRDLNRWEQRSQATLGSLQGNTCQAALVVADIEGELQDSAREFGRNLGLAWQAHTELQPFLNQTYEPIQLPDMLSYPSYDLNCLPVILFLRDAYHTKTNFRLMVDEIKGLSLRETSGGTRSSLEPISLMNQHRHQESIDYQRLHEMILRDGRAIDEAYQIIYGYANKAQEELERFPPSKARDILRNICESLYRK